MAQLLWTQKQDVGPSARSNVAMVFDAARNRVVLFGGAGGSTAILFNDTWEWDGENWTQYEDIGPVPRSRHGMAYDSKRQRTVLFGGSAGNLNLNDTWEWDGADWTQVADTGPPARGGHGMAYDNLRGRVVLVDGVGESVVQVSETVSDSGWSGWLGGTHTETHQQQQLQFFNDTWE